MNFPRAYSVEEIARLTSGKIIGDRNAVVTGLNELHKVRKGDITFVDHPKYYSRTLSSEATIILINAEREVPQGKALILCDDPFAAFMSLINDFRPFVPVDEKQMGTGSETGEGTVLQPGVFIGNNVKIGKNCLIHSNVSIYDHSIIGDNVVIHSNSVIGSDGYYFQKKNGTYRKFVSGGRVIIEDDVEIGALCSIDRGVTSDTVIGKGTKMDNHCQVGHDTVIGKNCLIGAFSAIAGVTTIEDDVILWARVAINKDITIGKGAVLLSTTGADKSLEGGKTYMGAPAVEVRNYWREQAAKRKLPEILKQLKL